MVIFLQRILTSLVHAHAGRTQGAAVAPVGRWDAQNAALIWPPLCAALLTQGELLWNFTFIRLMNQNLKLIL